MATTTFSMLLTQIMEASDIRFVRDAYKIISEKRVDISYPTFANYKSFNTVPSYNIARQILDALGYSVSDEELVDILDYSNKELKSIRDYGKKTMQRGISLIPSYFGEDLNADTLQSLIEVRVHDLFGENGNVNHYINQLIKTDLIRHGLLEEGGK